MLQTGNYTVVSRLNDFDTLEWARAYDQFIASTARMLGINPKALPPLTVIGAGADGDPCQPAPHP